MATPQKKTLGERDASVVIPTYNRPNLALEAAEIIRSFHKDIEIIIVDQLNSSEIDATKANRLRVQYLNLGRVNTSYAKNTGIQNALGSVVFFFDDDIEITKNTIPEQLAAYDDPNVAATCGRVINDDETVPEDTDVETGTTNRLATRFLLQYWSTKAQDIDFPYGCNMSFRKDALTAVGGFDERFPKIFEEIDLGVRVSRNVGHIRFVPKALAYHHKAVSGGTRTTPPGKMKMIYRSYGTYMAKHVIFPLSLVPLALRTRTALREAPYAVLSLYAGYCYYFVSLFQRNGT